MEAAKAEDPDSHFLLYRFSTDGHHDDLIDSLSSQVDFIDVLAAAGNAGFPFLPIVWQTARASIALGGTSTIRRAPIDIQTELAFKLVKEEENIPGNEGGTFSIILNEINTLSYLRLLSHPNIVDLLGICWDIAENSFVWPGLVFEKSHFGDLRHFMTLPIWEDFNSKDKLKICVDIGNALSEMHSHSEWARISNKFVLRKFC